MVTLAVVLLVASHFLDAMVFERTSRRQFYIEDDIDEGKSSRTRIMSKL